MQTIYFTAEQSATARGFVGLVIDAATKATIYRTHLTYATPEQAEIAAKRMWLARPAKLHAAQEVAA